MRVIEQTEKEANVLVLNLEGLGQGQMERAISKVKTALEVELTEGADMGEFYLEDDDYLTLIRNGDYLEPDPETENGCF